MANNFNAARAMAAHQGAPQPTPQGRGMAQQIALRYNAAFSGLDRGPDTPIITNMNVNAPKPAVTPPTMPVPNLPDTKPQGVQPGWWKDKTFQTGAAVAAVALLVLWLQARNDRR